MANSQIAIVTGSNKGLGLSIVKLLAQQNPALVVYLTARDERRGLEAVSQLATNFNVKNVVFLQLDIDDLASIRRFKEQISHKHPGGVSILVNNAGIMPNPRLTGSSTPAEKNNSSYKFNKEALKATVTTNHFGTLNVLEEMLPLMAKGGRVANISSRAAQCVIARMSPENQARFRNVKTIDELNSLADNFASSFDDGEGDDEADFVVNKRGWLTCNPADRLDAVYTWGDYLPIGFTHATIAVMTSIFQQKANNDNEAGLKSRNVVVSAVCPGRFKTEMYPGTERTADEAAERVLHAINRPLDQAVMGAFLSHNVEYANWLDVPSST